ncbi:hypothetical protein [Dyadobacter beijingensis]|uniref:hypothetical protein n=1 Tax=Dyadobacter beijingensis TaxID=365489 RepID=UPI00036A69A2|nr:hypothetical protein [Dyadobacter beijingensis]
METLIIFLGVFLPVAWGIWRLVQYTKDTIGTNSPVKVKRTYRAKSWTYFATFDNVMLYLVGMIGFFLVRGTFTFHFVPENNAFIGRIFVFTVGALLVGGSLCMLLIDLNHWKYARGVVIETFPERHELEITFEDAKLRLKEGDIVRILVTGQITKMHITYTTFHLDNGHHFILPYKMPGIWVIQEYFKKIPTEFRHKRFPFIP